MSAYLERKGVEQQTAAAVLARLADERLLDDERYAARFAADKRALQGWGSERIEEALLGRGIEPGTAEAAATSSPEDELAAAAGLLEREPVPRSNRDRDRALKLLVRRGYPLELAYDAVRARERSGG